MISQSVKSKDSAITSFILGWLSFIPFLNIGFSIFAMYFGFSTLIKINKYPEQYGGFWYALFGAVSGTSWFIGNLIFFYIQYLHKV